MVELFAALTLGFLGSLHCIGMCGPLALAVPSSAQSRSGFVFERIIFNSGRIVTYTFMGIFIGMIGNKLLLANIQQNISIVLGMAILLSVILPLSLKSRFQKFSPLTTAYTFVKKQFGTMLKKKGSVALFILGMLNGLLPCGLVYTALIGAAAVADFLRSGLFMMLFGLGTLPALVAVAFAGKVVSVKFRSVITKSIPALSIVLAVILILRGLNLGIPMVSPKASNSHMHMEQKINKQADQDCCE